MTLLRLSLIGLSLLVAGCASITAQKVTANNSPPGVRYSLPLPVIQVAPQANGTTALDVLYLPDSKNTYAVDTSCFMAAYAFDLTVDQNGLLNKVEFKDSTTGVPQQLAATGGAVAASVENARSAQAAAAQTAMDAAQKDADDATAAAVAARAKVTALQNQSPPATQDVMNAALADLAQADAKAAARQSDVDRARNAARAVNLSATMASPQVITGPSVSAGDFNVTAWKDSAPVTLPGELGAVLYAVEEGVVDGKPYCKLVTIKSLHAENPKDQAQAGFKSINLLPKPLVPSLKPPEQTLPAGAKEVVFVMEPKAKLSIVEIVVQVLYVQTPSGRVLSTISPKAVSDKAGMTVTLPLSAPPSGAYELDLYLNCKDVNTAAPSFGTCSVKFTVP
jgi:hypothetical protein